MEQPIDRLIKRLITIELPWRLICYLCYLSISIWWSRLWIISNTLNPPFEAFVIQCSVFFTRYTLSMYQIHLFINFKYDSLQPSLYAFYCVSKPKLSRSTPVKPVWHWPARFWLLSSSYYPGYPIEKLTSHHKGRRPIVSYRLLILIINRGAQKW